MDVDSLSEVLFEQVAEHLRPPRRIWAVLDAAHSPDVMELVRTAPEAAECLFRDAEPALAEAGPWLVPLVRGHEWTYELLDAGWGRSWGVFVEAAVPADRLRRHLRSFLRVKDEDGRTLFFRWYDPRVLRLYLPTTTAAETQRFAGPVRRFLCESEDARSVLVDEPSEDAFVRSVRPLQKGASSHAVTSSAPVESPARRGVG